MHNFPWIIISLITCFIGEAILPNVDILIKIVTPLITAVLMKMLDKHYERQERNREAKRMQKEGGSK